MGLSQGLIENVAFAQIVLVVLVTTLITPLMLHWIYARADRSETDPPAAPAATMGA